MHLKPEIRFNDCLAIIHVSYNSNINGEDYNRRRNKTGFKRVFRSSQASKKGLDMPNIEQNNKIEETRILYIGSHKNLDPYPRHVRTRPTRVTLICLAYMHGHLKIKTPIGV